MDRARREIGNEVTIHCVEGGYIVDWSEAEIIPESRRTEHGRHFEVVSKRAVREKLGDALKMIQELLAADRVNGSRWE